MNLIISTLMMNNYPRDFMKRIIKKEGLNDKVKDKLKGQINTVVVPYRKGISEEIRSILNLQNIKVFFRTNNTLVPKLVRIKYSMQKEEQQTRVMQ